PPPSATSGFDDFTQTVKLEASTVQFDTPTFIKWGILLVIAIIIAFWHQRQNKQVHSHFLHSKSRSPINDALRKLAYGRSYEVLALLCIVMGIIVFYDIKISSQSYRSEAAQQIITDQQNQIITYEKQYAVIDQQVKTAMNMGGFDEVQQQQFDALKQEFEGLFINYYVLKKCGLSSTQDFHIMNSALMYRLNQLNAPSAIRRNILDAANGSYVELYADQACEDHRLESMQTSIREYLRSVVETYPDH
ncbi:MAG: hypothetical protein MK052_11030, partial [Alphaproteobacteria bacterium]|nr:hypothetical protein [Alphaproteobacteria bacterium]